MKSLILKNGEQFYTYLGAIFSAIENKQCDYNWLITDCECYPPEKELENLFCRKYTWLSGEELTKIIRGNDFQFVWGVFSGFPKGIELTEVLEYELPFADENKQLWSPEPSIQHPLADIEIVAWDSSMTLVLSKDECIIDKFLRAFPLSENLAEYNMRLNLQVIK